MDNEDKYDKKFVKDITNNNNKHRRYQSKNKRGEKQ